ncbi:MAG: nucleotidyltransferase domain-containing protein [Chloroflexi bacterium]|nr:nucleotidyltransferase domain-containing protein [Chloroflexota bacterium]
MAPESVVAALVERIVAAVRPRRVVLFGSAARGQAHPHSDIDLLVVMPDGTHRRRTAQQLYRALAPLGIATDVVVVTEADLHACTDYPALVVCQAAREGVELYRAVPVP